MEDWVVGYAAGILDGEGSVCLVRLKPNEQKAPTVYVSSTTPEILEVLKKHFGGWITKGGDPKKDNHRRIYQWVLQHGRALKFLELVEPYLFEPEKKRKAQLLLTQYKEVTPRNGKYTPEMKIKKEAFEHEFLGSPR